MIETENQEAELQNFRAEIKKVKESFPSLFAVENVDDLQLEEDDVWQEYKMLFADIEKELSEFDMPAKDILIEFKSRVEDLGKRIHKSVAGIKNSNRQEFLAWINNRLGILLISLDFLQNEDRDGSALQKIKNTLSRERKQLLF